MAITYFCGSRRKSQIFLCAVELELRGVKTIQSFK